jgi:general secretion pathway protein D
MKLHQAILLLTSLIMIACTSTHSSVPVIPSTPSLHIQATDAPISQNNQHIPSIITRHIALPAPQPSVKIETYSVVVNNVSAREILFALARDAKINLDIHPDVQGNVTLNAIDQSVPQLLHRIAKQINIRYELEGNNLIVLADSPYLKIYKIDYVNMSRDADGGIANATQVGTTAQAGGGMVGNNSKLAIINISKNHFWERLESNIKDILRETDLVLPEGSSETVVQQNNNTSSTGHPSSANLPAKKSNLANRAEGETPPNEATFEEAGTTVTRRNTFREAAAVIMNPESGLMTVRATSKQHEKIQEVIAQIMASARRQVLIEATIVEVRLSEQYQQGINWSNLSTAGSSGFQFSQAPIGSLAAVNTGSLFTLNYAAGTSNLGALAASIKLMETFGTVKVLSSPKLSVLNNQTAMLRVVDNYVYFTINATTVSGSGGAPAVTTFSTTANSIPVGFTMSVTPQISDNDSVLLNMRPSITRLFGYVNDPNPDLARAGVVSQIPETQTREMESVLKISHNQIAVMGGLMQDELNNQSDSTPLLGRIPWLGNLFKFRNDKSIKSELIIFLRPVIIREAGLNGDFRAYRNQLPNADFFKLNRIPTPASIREQ